jgi:hypothetical protein
MTVQNEWEIFRLKADENIDRHRKAEARLRFIALNGAGFDEGTRPMLLPQPTACLIINFTFPMNS